MTAGGLCFGSEENTGKHPQSTSGKWESVGAFAAETSLRLISKAAAMPRKQRLIVLTNAGYAEVADSSTQGALDGLSMATEASRGRNTLFEIHSAPWSPLWFAIYDKDSGFCAYLEVDPSEAANIVPRNGKMPPGLFRLTATERIDAEHLYRHAAEYKEKFKRNVFGGNEFRVVTIANAIAAGMPAYAVRAVEFHDHYCPGLTSGIVMARYLKKHFPPGKTGYFVHSVDPWCKEDALMVLLNATPGKRGYAVSYPSKADITWRVPEAKNASTIVYRQNGPSGKWEGVVLGFEWAETSCPKSGNGVVDKLCADLWYLERLEKPEAFVKVIRQFELPDGTTPREWARPGVDPLQMLGLAKSE
jgi:formylmethanofuran dehydrogenase subunit E-like metal-binding protein